MKKNLFSVFLSVVLLTLIIPHFSQAKGVRQWFLTPRIGTAFLMNEVSSGFSAVPKDYKNGNGFSADLTLSRTIGTHLEVGLSGGFYQFSSANDSIAIKDLSSYFPISSERINENRFNGLFIFPNAPIEYNTNCVTASILVRYYFKRFATRVRDAQKFQPYLEFNIGQNFINTELVYKDPSNFTNKELYTVLPSVWIPYPYVEGKDVSPYQSPETNLQYALSLGSKFNLNGGLTLNLAAEFSSVQTQFMDGTPNLRADNVTAGIVGRIMFGIVIPLTESHTKNGQYLPWAP